MRLLIDGYNLMFDAGFTDKLQGDNGLQRSRQAMLRFIVGILSSDEAAETVIVFDASDAPPGLPPTIEYHGIVVHFARNHADADEMIEELIRANHVPKQLTVVSSDHRLHKAAQRRKAKSIDSADWFEEIKRRGKAKGYDLPEKSTKPKQSLSMAEIERWTALFSDETLDAIIFEESRRPTMKPSRSRGVNKPPATGLPQTSPKSNKPSSQQVQRGGESRSTKPADATNPFPPGYGDDIDFEV